MTEIKGDLISREWLKDAFDNLCCHDCKICRNFRNEDSFYKCNLIENAPTIERPHGEWKEFTVSTYRGTDEWGEPKWGKGKKFICERCGRRTVIRENFCPDCGADMRKEGEEEDGYMVMRHVLFGE